MIKNIIELWSRPFVGDVNYHGVVNLNDAEIVASYSSGYSCNVRPYSPNVSADTNNDGIVDANDAAVVCRTRRCDSQGQNCSDVALAACDNTVVDPCGVRYFAPASASSCYHTDNAGFTSVTAFTSASAQCN